MDTTTTRPLTSILADLADFTVASTGTKATALYHELEDAVRAQLAPLPEGEIERIDAERARAARTMAPPVPGVTRNAGYTIRAVIHMHPHQEGLLETWVVACEDPDRGAWVTWDAYALDGRDAGRLAYSAGHNFTSSDPALNRRQALADLAVRAGTMTDMAHRIANVITNRSTLTAEERRTARGLLRFFGR